MGDNVSVTIENSEADSWDVTGEIPAEVIPYGKTENCFVVLERKDEAAIVPGTFACELSFLVVNVDPATGEEEGEGFQEEYPLEDLEITTCDFMAKVAVGDFRRSWETMTNENEVLEKFALQFKKLEDAVSAVIDFLGMMP